MSGSEPRHVGTIVGEAPGFTGEGGPPLGGMIGERLASIAGLGSYVELSKTFKLMNVLDHFPGRAGRGVSKGAAFPTDEAEAAAKRKAGEIEGRVVIFLGRRVAQAFGFRRREYLTWFPFDGRFAAIVPHPSGVNRWWNELGNRRRAERFFDDLLGRGDS